MINLSLKVEVSTCTDYEYIKGDANVDKAVVGSRLRPLRQRKIEPRP